MGVRSLNEWFMSEVLPLEHMLTGFLQRNRCSAAEVADLSQETFARIYEAAKRERPLLVKPFLFQIARNLIIDHLRKQNVVSLETMADREWMDVPDDGPSSERQAAARQELRLLQSALDELPTRCRQIVMMQRIDGLSQKDIAQQMGISVETVQTQIARGMRLLAQALGGRRAAVTTEARRHNFLNRPRDAR